MHCSEYYKMRKDIRKKEETIRVKKTITSYVQGLAVVLLALAMSRLQFLENPFSMTAMYFTATALSVGFLNKVIEVQ